jgi:hypothetical protein
VLETVKDVLLLALDATIGFRMASRHNGVAVTALTWAAEVVSLLPEDHPLFEKLAQVDGERWRDVEWRFLSRWGSDSEVVDTGLMFVVELGALADRFREEV